MYDWMFRAEAFSSKSERQQLDRFLTVSSRYEYMVFIFAGILILVICTWLWFGEITRGILTEGVLIASGTRHELVATEPGRLVEYLVDPGEPLAAGEPIARQTVPSLDRELALLAARVVVQEILSEQATDVVGDDKSILDAAQAALLQLETGRLERQMIFSPVTGEMMAHYLDPGEYLATGNPVALVREMSDGPFRVVAWVTPTLLRQIRPGYAARVNFTTLDGTEHDLGGIISTINTDPTPNWLKVLYPDATGHRVEILLDQQPVNPVTDGEPSSIRIILPPQAPASLLFSGRP